MRMSRLIGERYKDNPADAKIESHAIMVRGGYIKQVTSGIYSLYTPTKRIIDKIENIIRQEMDNIDGQEVLFPVVLPATLWEESGRFESVGDELVRIKDRFGSDMVLGMTHEEAAVDLVRNIAQSYTQYPFMIYQIQTKFRDEARSRGGLIRVREFTMKDAYSFHTSEADLEDYYARCHKSYERIYSRCGISEVVSVQSDSGMMGGDISHEFILLTEVGEDTIVICNNCDYKSNVEAAACIVKNTKSELEELTLVNTPNIKSIDDVHKFFSREAKDTVKAVIYQKNSDNSFVAAFVRGDLEIDETKLQNKLGTEIYPARTEDDRIINGFIGLYGLDKSIEVLVDDSLKDLSSLICGANKSDYHYSGFNIERDYGDVNYVDIAKAFEGSICPNCGKPNITLKKGIEVGNIFQLGTKYTKSMGMKYMDSNGDSHHPIMGCYGIGVGRLVASVCEVRRDSFGPIWPITIAPWQAQICGLRIDNEEVKTLAESIYNELTNAGIEVLFDDRVVSAGVMFSDADLLGVPIRVTVSPRNLKENVVEISTRDKTIQMKVDVSEAVSEIIALKNSLLDNLNKFEDKD